MARNTSADSADRPGFRQTGLKAIQELIGAISAGLGTVTTHLSLEGCDLYIFALPTPAVRTEDASELHGNGTSGAPLQSGGKLKPAATLSLDEVISIVCSGLGVARIRLVSKSRAPAVSLARALVAWHGPKVSTASDSQVAAAIKMTETSMRSAVGRWRKRMPELFVTWDGFLKSSKMARAELREEPKPGSIRPTNGATTDAELGQRIAHALAPSDKKS
jgi:hypothetical protein